MTPPEVGYEEAICLRTFFVGFVVGFVVNIVLLKVAGVL